MSKAARQTLRSNLLFLTKRVLVLDPPPVPLGREASQAPYSEAEIARYLALPDAQPTPERRSKASGLIALGAGAGLIGADLRLVTGLEVHARSGGVVVEVRGIHPRVVPVRAEMAARAMQSARFAGGAFIVGGAEPNRRNITSRLIASLAPGQPRAALNGILRLCVPLCLLTRREAQPEVWFEPVHCPPQGEAAARIPLLLPARLLVPAAFCGAGALVLSLWINKLAGSKARGSSSGCR